MKKYVDLSLPLQNPNDEEMGFMTSNLQPKIKYEKHEENASLVREVAGVPEKDWEYGHSWETLELVGHAGTHIDAPWHFYPTTENGAKQAKTVEQLPLEWFSNDGVVLDLRHIKDGEQAQLKDIKGALEKINYTLKPLDIVCLFFNKDKDHGTAAYWKGWPGINAEVVHWLVDQGIKVIGTDSLGQDCSFETQLKQYQDTEDVSCIWSSHRAGVQKEFCNMEKMANLDKLPPYGFKISCFPMPIKGGSGAWCRPVAIIEERI